MKIIKLFRVILEIIGFITGIFAIIVFRFIKSIERENSKVEENLYG